jgi:ribosomal protein S18 acetylase RimI-like enzyme
MAQSNHSVTPASFPGDLELVRQLFREYAASLDLDLEYQGFSAELASLPGAYAVPRGSLLLARDGEEVAGCVAMRPLDHAACEMKRLYVRPGYRGTGMGRRLVEAVVDAARSSGYSEMKLDTLASMLAAQGLYRELGFREIAPYSEHYVPGTRFFALTL